MAGNRTAMLIPYFNDMSGLIKSMSSIDPSEHCDVLVVDDGSTVEPADELAARASFRAHGSVEIVRLPRNRGIEGALNAGLIRIRDLGYEFVARLDCGDQDVGRRIALQEQFMDEHPPVLLLGGAAAFVDPTGAPQFVLRLPTSSSGIAAMMRRNSAFMHPTVMFRVAALDRTGLYPCTYPAAEDYAFFWRFLEIGEVANLPEVLIRYELNPGGISLARRATQLRSRLRIQAEHSDGSCAARWGILRTRLLQFTPYRVVHAAKRLLHG